MVMHYEKPAAQCEVFIVRPNNSLKWQHAKMLFKVFAAMMLGMALIFWSLGAWLVFPFVVLELIVLAFGLYQAALKAYSREVISVGPAAIQVEQGRDRLVFRTVLPHARVHLQQGEDRLSPAHLYLQSAESEVEIGGCLVESERTALADDLSRAVVRYGL